MFSLVGLCFGMVVRLFRGQRSLLLNPSPGRKVVSLSFPLPAEKAFQARKGSQPNLGGSLVTLELHLTLFETTLRSRILTQACERALPKSDIKPGFLGRSFQPEGYIHA